MEHEATITNETQDKMVILRVNLSAEFPIRGDTHGLGKKLIASYADANGTNPSCVVVIDAVIAGAFLGRALFELYQVVVTERGGKLLCVNFPKDYIATLEILGITSLEGFLTFDNLEEAIETP